MDSYEGYLGRLFGHLKLGGIAPTDFPRLSGPARPGGLAIVPCRLHWRVPRTES